MKLVSLELTDFRNYQYDKIEFGFKKNFFLGKNAQGKTNLLEAIYLLCLSKSFKTSHEKEAIKFSKKNFIIKGNFLLDAGDEQKVVFHCSYEKGKQVIVNRKRLNKTSELIGKFPIVQSSPEDYSLTIGPPPERRKFVNILLSQISKKYFSLLQEYQRIIQQRNSILHNYKITGSRNISLINPWNLQLIQIGGRIIQYREEFSSNFSINLKKIYSNLIVNDEQLSFSYKSNINFNHINDIESNFEKKINLTFNKEIQRGISLLGPHRDDFIFKINGNDIKKYGSRGQHKTVLLSIAIAQYELIKERLNEEPILLIDDLYSEIDKDREQKILEKLSNLGQIFITSTDTQNERESDSDKKFLINDSKVSHFEQDL